MPRPSRRLLQEVAEAAAAAPKARKRYQPGEVDLVAPPDPLSNIRPIIYATPLYKPSNSPYSATEFPMLKPSEQRLYELQLSTKMQKERVDMENHRFWATTNLAFEAQRDARLAALNPSDPPTPEDLAKREAMLSQFYRDWQVGNRDRMIAWVEEWWRQVWIGIKMQAKVYLAGGWRKRVCKSTLEYIN